MKVEKIISDKFGWKGVSGRSVRIDDKASLEHIKITTPISKRKSLHCDRTYFILSGTAEFIIEDKKKLVKAKEAIFIPKNTLYSYRPKKKTELIELNLPPYEEKYEIISDK